MHRSLSGRVMPSTPSEKRLGYSTSIVAELPAQMSPKKSPLARAMSTASRKSAAATKPNKSNKKGPFGKRKRAQTAIVISAPTNFRHVDSGIPATLLPTYPSPSRIRPDNLKMERHDPSLEDAKRPQTAPSEISPRSRESFPFRSDSLPLRDFDWKLAPIPAMPALDMQDASRERKGSGSTPTKRKPVPIHTRAISSTASPHRIPSSFAAEMLGSVPSPIEPTTAPQSLLEALIGHDELPNHNSDLPDSSLASPVPEVSPTRLSVGAHNMLALFPAPQPSLSVGKRSRSNSRARSRSVSTARSHSTTRKRSEQGSESSVLIPEPLFSASGGISSPSLISPRTKTPSIEELPQKDPAPFVYKSLPPTPKTGNGFDRGRFISIASGIPGVEMEEWLVPLPTPMSVTSMASDGGKRQWPGSVGGGSDSESIHIFLAHSAATSPRVS